MMINGLIVCLYLVSIVSLSLCIYKYAKICERYRDNLQHMTKLFSDAVRSNKQSSYRYQKTAIEHIALKQLFCETAHMSEADLHTTIQENIPRDLLTMYNTALKELVELDKGWE